MKVTTMLNLATSVVDITPASKIDLSGFLLRKNPATGVHDPLKMRWISFCDDAGLCALLGSADVLSFSRQSFQGMRKEILAGLGNSYAHIGLATSHTHSGPATVRLRNCGQMSRSYLHEMKQSIISSAVAAGTADHSPVAKIRLASTSVDLNINRRQGESGPVDKELMVLSFDAPDGQCLGTIVNYACHPVVLGHENCAVSADYPGALCAAMEQRTGATCVFLNGACGDVNPRSAHHVDPAAAREMGETLAEAALQALGNAAELKSASPTWHRCTVKLPVYVPKSIDEVHQRLDHLEKHFGVSRSLFANRIERDRHLLQAGRYPKTISLQISLLSIGDEAAILFVPGELFSSIGLRAKQMAMPRKLMIAGFSNGSVGYLSDRQAYDDGGYEPCYANFFYDFPKFQPTVEDDLLDAVRSLLNASAPAAHIAI